MLKYLSNYLRILPESSDEIKQNFLINRSIIYLKKYIWYFLLLIVCIVLYRLLFSNQITIKFSKIMQEFSPGFKGLILLRFFHSLICGIIFTFLKPDILAQLFLIVYFLKRSYKEFCEFNNTPVSKREFALGVFYPALFIIIMTGIIPDVIVLLYRQVMFYLRTHSFRPYFFMSLFSTLIENIVIAIIIVMLSFRFYMKTKSPWFSAICAIIAIVIIPSLVNLTVTLLINPVQTSNGIIWKIVYNALLYSIYFLMIRSIGNTIESDLYPRYNAITHEKGNWLA